MQTTLFPHESVREEQDKLIDATLRAIDRKGRLVVHAPTGLGKTAATLAPAIERAIALEKTVIFMTSPLTQHQLALETVRRIRAKHKIHIPVVDLIGKKHLCLQPGVERLGSKEFAEYCKAMREDGICEFFTRLKQGEQQSPIAKALITRLGTQALHTPDEVRSACEDEHTKLCPYEITMLLAKEARVIICDYSYIFNATIRDNFFNRINKELNDCILIVDEGHNLPNRVKDLASERISTLTIRRAIGELERHGEEDRKHHLRQLGELIERMATNTEEERHVTRGEFIDGVDHITQYEDLSATLERVATAVREEQKSSSCGVIADFLAAWTGGEDGYTRILNVQRGRKDDGETKTRQEDEPTDETERDTTQNTTSGAQVQRSLLGETIIIPTAASRPGAVVQLSYRCLDAGVITKSVFEAAHAAVLMSGTLTPPEMYAKVLGMDDAELLTLASPFPKENRLNIIIPRTTTKFTARSENMYRDISTVCAQCVGAVPGNIAIFFPSYHIMEEVRTTFDTLTDRTVFAEHPSFTAEERESFLMRFRERKQTGAVLLGVMGGSFSEGIDLPGDELRAVIVVGLPLSRPDLETKALIDHYQEKFKKGWEYGYTYPAFNKTLQSAGRCIRTETDRGTIVFIDERYAWQNYYSCFPKDWNIKITLLYERIIREFFTDEWNTFGATEGSSREDVMRNDYRRREGKNAEERVE